MVNPNPSWTKVETQSIKVNIAGTESQNGGSGGSNATAGSSEGLKLLGALLLLLLLYFVFRRK